MKKDRKVIPQPVIGRLTKYLAYAEQATESGREWVSSKELAESLGLTRSTVRQDITHLDLSGMSGHGYETEALRKSLIRTLGLRKGCEVVIVGAGNLGRALARHKEFSRKGFRISAIVDSNAKLEGKKVGSLFIKGMDALPRLVQKNKVSIGIIAVPPSSAQEAADRLVQAGVRGLLNLACTHVATPSGVAVVESRTVANMRELCCAISMRS